MTLARAARRRRNVFTRIMDSVPGKGFARTREGESIMTVVQRERKKENKMMQFKWECDYGISYK